MEGWPFSFSLSSDFQGLKVHVFVHVCVGGSREEIFSGSDFLSILKSCCLVWKKKNKPMSQFILFSRESVLLAVFRVTIRI